MYCHAGGFESGNFYGWSLFPSANDIIEIVSPGASGDFAAHIKNMQTTSGSVIKNAEIFGGGPLMLDPDPLVWTHYEFDVLTGPDTSAGLTVQFAAVTGADPNSMMDLYVDNLIVALDCTVSQEATSWGSIKTLFR